MDAYEKFDFEQFVEDPAFRSWVLAPSDEADVFWQNFLTIYPHKEGVMEEAKAFLQGTKDFFEQQGASKEQLEQELQKVFQRGILKKPTPTHRFNHDRPRLRKFRKINSVRVWMVAASVAFVLGICGWLWSSYMSQTILYATDFGEWRTIELADGSSVQLNANSQLTVPKKWEKGTDRRVTLQGEAFFRVTEKPATGAKFTVITNDLAVEVMGTSFNVLARGEATEVFLQEGKVKLSLGEDTTWMEPGDFVAYSSIKEKILDRYRRDNETENTSPDTWKDGVIMFRKENAFPILKKLEEIYGVKMEVKNDAIYTKKYDVNVPMEDLTVVIAMLEKSMGVKIIRDEQRLILEKRETE